jgi:hypothetical protein
MTSVYDKNRMNYSFQKPESVKLVPTDLQQIPFDNQSYDEGRTMTLTFSSGGYYVDPQKSYISLAVSITGDNISPLAVNWGKGSCANLFGGVRIYHKSGTQITHNTNLDLWTKAKQYIEKDAFWFDTQGIVQGYLADPYGAGQVFWSSTQATPETHNFKIKLSDLHPFFRGTDNKILSPQIIDGLRIELDLNSKGRAFFTAVASSPIVEYTVSPDLQCALVDCQDQASDIVNDIANKRGLQWEFNDVFITTVGIDDTQNDFTVPLDKAVSLAQNVITFTRTRTGDNTSGFDSHVFDEPSGSIKWNYRIANVLYPYKRQVTNRLDTYTNLVDNFDWQFGTNLSYNEWLLYNHCYTTLLRTEDHLLNTGIYLNANKKVELEFQKQNSNDLLVHTCLEHRKLLTVNGVNSKIDT